jgi:hypothetical protein
VPNLDDQTRRARQRAQDQVAAMLRKGRRPQRGGVHIPVLEADPTYESGINLWMDPAGNLRSWAAGPTPTKYQYTKTAVTAAAGTLPVQTQPVTLQQTYTADWGRTFCDQHGVETAAQLGYGDSPDGAHTGRQLMLGLPDATIRTDLTGADIDAVEIAALNLDAATPNVWLHWGLHNIDAAPASYSAMRKDAYVAQWPKVGYDPNGGTWRPVDVAFGLWLRDNQAKGLTIDQPAGVGNGGLLDWATVQIRITYTV